MPVPPSLLASRSPSIYMYGQTMCRFNGNETSKKTTEEIKLTKENNIDAVQGAWQGDFRCANRPAMVHPPPLFKEIGLTQRPQSRSSLSFLLPPRKHHTPLRPTPIKFPIFCWCKLNSSSCSTCSLFEDQIGRLARLIRLCSPKSTCPPSARPCFPLRGSSEPAVSILGATIPLQDIR